MFTLVRLHGNDWRCTARGRKGVAAEVLALHWKEGSQWLGVNGKRIKVQRRTLRGLHSEGRALQLRFFH